MHLPVDAFISIFLTPVMVAAILKDSPKNSGVDTLADNKGFFTYRELPGGGRSLLIKADDAALVS